MTNRLPYFLLLPLLMALMLSADQSRAQQQCFHIDTREIRLGNVLIGGRYDTSFTLIADTSRTFSITKSIEGSFSSYLRVTPETDPIILQGGARPELTFHIDSVPPGEMTHVVVFRDQLGCVDTLFVYINGVDTTESDAFLPFTPGLPQMFAFNATSEISEKTFSILNSTGAGFSISSVIVDDTSKIRNLSTFPALPFFLGPQSTLSISFTFIADSTGFHRSGVRVPTDHGLASEYSIQTIRFETGIGSVPPIVTKGGITITQSHTEIAIEGLPFDQGTLTIYDLLGRPVRQAEITAIELFFQKKDNNGQPLPDGCYILTVRDRKGRVSESFKMLLLGY